MNCATQMTPEALRLHMLNWLSLDLVDEYLGDNPDVKIENVFVTILEPLSFEVEWSQFVERTVSQYDCHPEAMFAFNKPLSACIVISNNNYVPEERNVIIQVEPSEAPFCVYRNL